MKSSQNLNLCNSVLTFEKNVHTCLQFKYLNTVAYKVADLSGYIFILFQNVKDLLWTKYLYDFFKEFSLKIH